ncbi:MAG: UbiD family decarboxylase [Dehalococcoidia bacterium]|nr:UbiD family decarboxylase [Dehalococcoidia bacterium]
MSDDLRDFIRKVEQIGECRVVEGADWNEEIGDILQAAAATPGSPMMVFDAIKGYPPGFRVVTNIFTSPRRYALAMGLEKDVTTRGLVEHWRARLKEEFRPVPPVYVDRAPIKDNVLVGDEVDLYKFPAPKWHSLDGGRYIGTGCMVITRDPDEGWVNLGTYRVQVHGKATATIYITPGHHGDIMRRKYWAKGLSCPVVVTCGQDINLTFVASSGDTPWGRSEYEDAGWLQKSPVEVTRGLITDLPIPAHAEIALEGELVPPEVETREEGPFGEWTGYYASAARPEPVFRVKAILHRNNPIILGAVPTMNHRTSAGLSVRRSAEIWNDLDRKYPGVKGVWQVEEARSLPLVVVSLNQMYGGHAKQVALACAAHPNQAYMARWIIVVDEDIDPFNITEVLWALGTRCDPASAVDIVHNWWGSVLDPALSPEKRKQKDLTHSLGIILACKPYHWKAEFPPSIKLSEEKIAEVKKKWPSVFKT